MLRTVPRETHNDAAVLRVADGDTESKTETLTEAVQESATNTETVVAALLDLCALEQRIRDKKHHDLIYLWFPIYFCAIVVAHWVFQTWYGNGKTPSLPSLLFQSLFSCAIVIFIGFRQNPADREAVNAAKRLATLAPDAPQTLAALLDTLPLVPVRSFLTPLILWQNVGALFPALATALWNAGDDLALTLTGTRRARLRGTLNALWHGDGDLSTGEADFCAAAIKALAVTGDAKTKRLLKQIATGDASTANRKFVRSLAADVLLLLTERAAENTAHAKSFRALLHVKNKAVDLCALDNFAQSLGEARMQSVAQHYLQTGNRAHRLKCYTLFLLPSLVVTFIVSTHFAPSFTNDILFLAVIVPAMVGSYALAKQLEAASADDKTRMRLVIDHATRTDSAAIVPDLLDLAAQRKWRDLHDDKLLVALNSMKPGDGVFLEARHLAFLRGAVRNRSAYARTGGWATAFADAAIHALGVAGDMGAKRELELLLSDLRPENAPLRAAAFDTLVRINAAHGGEPAQP